MAGSSGPSPKRQVDRKVTRETRVTLRLRFLLPGDLLGDFRFAIDERHLKQQLC